MKLLYAAQEFQLHSMKISPIQNQHLVLKEKQCVLSAYTV